MPFETSKSYCTEVLPACSSVPSEEPVSFEASLTAKTQAFPACPYS